MSPVLGEQGEQERHGQVHDSIGGRANDTGHVSAALQGPVTGEVFLENTIAHRKA